jgi:hypothetical protein
MKIAAATAEIMTTTVSREVSSRLGHTDFLSSETVSRRKMTGLILADGWVDMIRALLLEALAMETYLTSRWVLCPRQREQYLLSSMRCGSLRRFFIVV